MKRKGKAIMMVALMLVAMMPMLPLTSGSDVTQTTVRNGYIVNPDNITISMDGNTSSILIGQNVQFLCEGNKTGPVMVIDATESVEYIFTSDSNGRLDTSEMIEGLYNASYEDHWELLAVLTPVMGLKLKVGTKEVSSICSGTPLRVDFTSYLDENDCVDLRIIDPVGIKLSQNPSHPNQKFDDINVSQLLEYGSENESKRINTIGWRVGEYRFSVRTEKENARGLDVSSAERTLAILKAEVEINAEKTSVVELEKVRLTIRGVYNHNVTISSSDPAHTIFPTGYDDNPSYTTSGFNDTLDVDGQRRYIVYFNDTGIYAITVTDTTANLMDSEDIEVVGLVTELNVNPQVVDPGEVISITGKASPNESVWVSSSFELPLPVSNGKYARDFDNLYFPKGEKTFSITAETIKNIQVSLSPVFWQTATITCSGRNMTVSVPGITETYPLAESIDETGSVRFSILFPVSIGPLTLDISGKKDIKVEGDAADGATSVNLKVSASVKVIADSSGDFSLPINTEGVPEGEFLISAGGIEKTVYIGVTPTPTPSPCFIATAAYGTPLHEDIDVLRDFRDEYLMPNPVGKTFVSVYYTTSPPIADVIRENEGLRTIVRVGLVKPLVYVTRWFVR